MEYIYYLDEGVLTKLPVDYLLSKAVVKPGTLYWNTVWENTLQDDCALKSMSHGEVRHASVIWENATPEETQLIKTMILLEG